MVRDKKTSEDTANESAGGASDEQATNSGPEGTASLEEQVAKLKSELLYQHAELENFKRRTQKRYEDALRYANEPIAKDLLSVLDNLERSLEHAGAEDMNSFTEGIKQIAEQLRGILSTHGIEEVNAEGEKFDPNLHEALAQVPGNEDGVVVGVHEKGYTLHGRLLRPAKVLVSKLAT
ncbi:MAG: nucleotide exchange factor GrpE [Deltaproteobacteria bacterium]|nr:MAG: nucleotide exchange factor GrpE [Deltaproteobacteria bacterium]